MSEGDAEMLKLHDRRGTCHVHADLVEVLGSLNKKLNLVIIVLIVVGTASVSKDVLASILVKLVGG